MALSHRCILQTARRGAVEPSEAVGVGSSFRSGGDQHLAGSDELAVALKRAKRDLDFRPGRLLLRLAESGEHLVQRAERLLLEPQTFVRGPQANRCFDLPPVLWLPPRR
jgi:hypothetical protein